MKNRGHTPGFVGVIICLVLALGCESKSSSPQPGERGETDTLRFTEASSGLPASGRWRQGIAFCDINHDGHMDIVALPPRLPEEGEGRPSVWYGDGEGRWSRSQLDLPQDMDFVYGSVAAGYFNDDEYLDIAFAMHTVAAKAFTGSAEGRYEDFSQGLPAKEEFSSRAVVSADFNNDGLSDLAFLSEGSSKRGNRGKKGIRVCYASQEGWRCSPMGGEAANGLFGDQITTGDVNGDGKVDIAAGSLEHTRNLIVWVNDGKEGFIPFNQGLVQGMHYPSVSLADIDGDGRDDLVASISGFGREGFMGIKVFLSRSDGFEEMSAGLPDREFFCSVRACDLNGDGDVKIVGGTGAGGLKIFSHHGRRWQELEAPGLPRKGLEKIYNVYCVDVNANGKKDIAVMSSSGGEADKGGIRVFLNRTGMSPGRES